MEDSLKTWMSNPRFQQLCQKIDDYIKKEGYVHPSSVILACSGGPDSVFAAYYLCYKTQQTSFNIVLAYFDHEWRKEAKQETEFCRILAKKLGFIFETKTATTQKEKTAHRYNGSKEAEGRELRYAFFYELQEKHHANYIVLGHHQDDQLETFFIRMIRGTSLQGLCGMKMIDGVLFRPLLSISKSEIVECLDLLKLPYRIDASNEDDAYLRNRIRKTVIPAFLSVDDRSINNIKELITRLKNSEKCLKQISQEIFKKISIQKNNALCLNIVELQNLPQELQYRVLEIFLIKNKIKATFSERFFQEILRFLNNKKSKAHNITDKNMLLKQDGYFVSTEKVS